MNSTVKIIEDRLVALRNEIELPYMGKSFYSDIQSKIDELESLLNDLNVEPTPKKDVEKFDVDLIFNQYRYNKDLSEADIFHLYDTGEECIIDNSGFHDSRHFNLMAFNTKTNEKCDLGRHDGLECITDLKFRNARIYTDGSFFIHFDRPASISRWQCVLLR